MRVRLFAALLLAPLAMAACDRNPLGTDARLVGDWESNQMQLNGHAPNGSTDVRYVIGWSFGGDGSFAESYYVVDAQTGRRWVMYQQAGTWGVSHEKLSLLIQARFVTGPETAVENPDPPRIAPEVQRAPYSLVGEQLIITPPCPPGASCIAPPALHRVELLSAR